MLNPGIFQVEFRINFGEFWIPGFVVNLVQRIIVTGRGFQRDEIFNVAIGNERDEVIQLIACIGGAYAIIGGVFLCKYLKNEFHPAFHIRLFGKLGWAEQVEIPRSLRFKLIQIAQHVE